MRGERSKKRGRRPSCCNHQPFLRFTSMCPLLKVRSTLFFQQKCSSGEKVPRSWRTTITVSMFLLILLPAGIFSEGRECRWIKKERDFMFFSSIFIDFLDFSPNESKRQMEVLLPVSALKARVSQSFTPMFRSAHPC